ncbi:Uncharacterised protein [Chlamydia trachomatis]|nr:Uncharacterised protein [Chlamydia trachomatis]
MEKHINAPDAQARRNREITVDTDEDDPVVKDREGDADRDARPERDEDIGIRHAGERPEEERLKGPRVSGCSSDDDEAKGESGGEEDADNGIFADPAVLGEDGNEDRNEDPGYGSSQEDRPLEREGDRDSGKYGVREGIADEGEPAQDDVRADNAADE